MKKIRLIAFLLTVSICATIFAGCGAKPENKTEETSSNERPDLTVYYLNDYSYFGTALGAYIYSHSKKYNISLTPFDSYEEMTIQLTAELAAGTGPDVVLLSENSDFDVYHALRNGQIADLSSFFAEDSSFSSDDYYSAILNGGTYTGRQYLVPFSFHIDTLCIEKESLDRTGYEISELNDFYDFTALIETFFETTDNETIAFTMSRRYSQSSMLSRYLTNSGLPIIDTDGNVSEDMDGIKIIMEHLAAMQDEYWEKETIWDSIKEGAANMYEKSICVSDNGNYLLVRSGIISLLESARNTEFVSLPWKNIRGQVQPTLCDYGFINQNSSHKEAAYDLLRYFMDYEIPFDFRYPLSVKKDFTEKDLIKLQHVKQFITQIDGAEIHTLLIDEAEAQEIKAMLDDMADAICYNTGYHTITSEKIKTYIETRDMDTAWKELKTELEQYLHG